MSEFGHYIFGGGGGVGGGGGGEDLINFLEVEVMKEVASNLSARNFMLARLFYRAIKLINL